MEAVAHVEQHDAVISRRSRRCAAAVTALALATGLGACSRPDPNPPIKLTGDPQAANPSVVTPTTTTSTSTTTTLFHAQEG